NPQGQDVYVGRANDIERRIGEHLRAGDKIRPGDTVHVAHRTDDYAAQRGLEQHEIRERGTLNPTKSDGVLGRNYKNGVDPKSKKAPGYEQAASDHLAANGQPHITSPAQQRGTQAAHGQSVTNGQRAKAVNGAHQNGNSAAGNKPSSSGSGTHHDGSGGSHSGGSKSNKGNGKGKGNRAKHARHGGH
ncbi:MAG: hypothetical protein ACRDDJ_18150, partial [[Mycobacterium] stephanolepidis]